MFRRKEDELNDAEQGSLLGGSESVKILSPETNSYAAPQSAASSAIPNAYAPPPPAPAPRAVAEPAPRPTAPAPASSFRPSQPAAPDISRQPRAPESKTIPAGFAGAAERHGNRESRRVLTVGSDILLKGEIATCDRLVIEGKVDAVLNDVGTVELAEAGSFKGVAQVENAEISGLFEGELLCKGRLVIYASGRVCGKITYGEIEIERGGEISGEIRSIASANAASSTRKPSLKEDRLKVEAA